VALSFEQFEDIRPGARAALRGVIRSCRDADEAEQAVRAFLGGLSRT
jgi:hypothetical protein